MCLARAGRALHYDARLSAQQLDDPALLGIGSEREQGVVTELITAGRALRSEPLLPSGLVGVDDDLRQSDRDLGARLL